MSSSPKRILAGANGCDDIREDATFLRDSVATPRPDAIASPIPPVLARTSNRSPSDLHSRGARSPARSGRSRSRERRATLRAVHVPRTAMDVARCFVRRRSRSDLSGQPAPSPRAMFVPTPPQCARTRTGRASRRPGTRGEPGQEQRKRVVQALERPIVCDHVGVKLGRGAFHHADPLHERAGRGSCAPGHHDPGNSYEMPSRLGTVSCARALL